MQPFNWILVSSNTLFNLLISLESFTTPVFWLLLNFLQYNYYRKSKRRVWSNWYTLQQKASNWNNLFDKILLYSSPCTHSNWLTIQSPSVMKIYFKNCFNSLNYWNFLLMDIGACFSNCNQLYSRSVTNFGLPQSNCL